MSTHVTSPEFVGSYSEASTPNCEALHPVCHGAPSFAEPSSLPPCKLIMLVVGAGIGLSAVSPWSNVGLTATTAGAIAITWLVIVEIIASAFGWYLARRLRTKWTFVHSDEVFFHDAANGFLAWVVALVVSAAFRGHGRDRPEQTSPRELRCWIHNVSGV